MTPYPDGEGPVFRCTREGESGPCSWTGYPVESERCPAHPTREGELTEDGLASFGDDGEDLLLALARTLTEQVEASEESLEGLFAAARDASQTLDASLAEDLPASAKEGEGYGQPVESTNRQREPDYAAIDPAEPSTPRLNLVMAGSAQQLRLF